MLEFEANLSEKLKSLLKKINPDAEQLFVEIETPRDKKYGDLSTNIAMKTSSLTKEPPIHVAQKIRNKLEGSDLMDWVERIEIVSPGFINFYFSWKFLRKQLEKIIKLKQDYGRNNLGKGRKVLLEFVSANPTGPLSIAHGRQAVIGNALANILSYCGWQVFKDYYVNDEGKQIELLGISLKSRYFQLQGKQIPLPQDGYQGEYLIDIARQIKDEGKIEEENFFQKFAMEKILSQIRQELEELNIKFERWRSQKEIREEGKIDKVINLLKEKGFIYEKDSALWFKSSKFDDDRDRVVKRSNGKYTYFAADIAYHWEKFQLGYNILINIWGPDHHGYIPRMKSAIKALGYDPDNLKILIVQLATVYKEGKPLPLSTREGKILTFRQVLDEVGKDATFYFLLMRKLDSHLDFDLDLAKKQSLENPVYYIQYAHARIANIIEYALSQGYNLEKLKDISEIISFLKEDPEKQILRTLVQFPRVIKIASFCLEPSLLTSYLYELASYFHSYYNKYRVVSQDGNLTKARLLLSLAVKEILGKGLNLLGISAPLRM